MKPYRTIIEVPLYGARVVLSVSDDVQAARAKEDEMLGKAPEEIWLARCGGLCSWWGLDFGLFFDRDTITHGALAHEIFHATHRILETVGVHFSSDNHEPFTYLCQNLTEQIYWRLHKAKLRLHL